MDKYEKAIEMLESNVKLGKRLFEEACDAVGNKTKSPSERARKAKEACELYLAYHELEVALKDICATCQTEEES